MASLSLDQALVKRLIAGPSKEMKSISYAMDSGDRATPFAMKSGIWTFLIYNQKKKECMREAKSIYAFLSEYI